MKWIYPALVLGVIWLQPSCNRHYRIERYEFSNQKLETQLPEDSTMLAEILPYRTALQKQMDIVIARCEEKLIKAKPECGLGNALTDLMLATANQNHAARADIALLNYGGIRIPEINPGNITVGKIFELLPFDNRLVVIELNGQELNELLNRIAKEGGWPVSGIRAEFSEGKLLKAVVRQESLMPERKYRILLSDYLANGGDKLDILIGKPQTDLGVLQREVVLEGLKELGKQQRPFSGKTDGRFIIQP